MTISSRNPRSWVTDSIRQWSFATGFASQRSNGRRVVRGGALFVVAIALAVAGCGGKSAARGGPLKHHFEPRYIAPIAIEEKQSVLTSQDAYARAEMAYEKAVADVGDSEVEVRVARNEVEQQKLTVKSCKERKSAADKCYEVKRISAATDELSAAERDLAVARARLSYVEGHHAYLIAQRDYLRQEQYVAEASVELERARLAESKDIRPPGATLADFETQHVQRADYARELAVAAEEKRAAAEDLRQKWESMMPPSPEGIEPDSPEAM